MSKVLHTFLMWWRSLFVVVIDGRVVEEIATPEPEVSPLPPLSPIKAVIHETEGEFYFRGAILDQLDIYFDVLNRMRKADNEAYRLYSKIGVNLVPQRTFDDGHIEDAEVSSWWKLNRPSTGAVAFTDLKAAVEAERPKKVWLPKFLYFSKYKHNFAPGEMEQPKLKGDIYKCTVYWDDGEKRGSPWQFGVVLAANGMVQVLKTKTEARAVRSKISHKKLGVERGGKRVVSVPSYGWDHNEVFRAWAAEHKHAVEPYLASVFIEAVNSYEQTQYSMIRVDVAKDGVHAAFGVNILRTPYFFKDRDLTVNHNGHKKRIFHIVRGHIRYDGAKVKTHFRGLREFEWNGYHLKITVPYRDHMGLPEFDVPALDVDAYKAHGGDMKRVMGEGKVGKMLRGMLDGKLPTDLHTRH